MKSLSTAAVAVCLAALVMSCAHQTQTVGNKAGREPAKRTKQVEVKSFAGSIDRINAAAGVVTVVRWPLYKTFHIGPHCEIAVPGKESGTLEDFKMDDLVIVYYETVGATLVATRFARRSEQYIRERQEQLQRLEEMLYPSQNP